MLISALLIIIELILVLFSLFGNKWLNLVLDSIPNQSLLALDQLYSNLGTVMPMLLIWETEWATMDTTWQRLIKENVMIFILHMQLELLTCITTRLKDLNGANGIHSETIFWMILSLKSIQINLTQSSIVPSTLISSQTNHSCKGWVFTDHQCWLLGSLKNHELQNSKLIWLSFTLQNLTMNNHLEY